MKKRTLRVFSRHPSHQALRDAKLLTPVLACIRLGSENPGKAPYVVEINTPEAVNISKNKLLMKRAFAKANVKTSLWIEPKNVGEIIKFFEDNGIIVSKNIFGSRGRGNTLLKSVDEIKNHFANKDLSHYIIESFYNYSKEYRLHVSELGCFYTCRKMLKNDTPPEKRWYRNDSNSSWIMEDNPMFEKPSNWNEVVASCVEALKAVGLDVGAFDLKIQSEKGEKKREKVDYIVIESNSAPAFGDITLQKYKEEIIKIINHKLKK